MHRSRRRLILALASFLILSVTVAEATPISAAGGGMIFYKAILTGRPAGDVRGCGTAVIELSLNTVCSQITASRIRLPAMGAHLMGPGPTGKVSVALAPPGRNGTSRGCTHVPRALLPFLVAHYHSYVVQVETVNFAHGALRGKLFKPRMPFWNLVRQYI